MQNKQLVVMIEVAFLVAFTLILDLPSSIRNTPVVTVSIGIHDVGLASIINWSAYAMGPPCQA